jgi:hypothetical protein
LARADSNDTAGEKEGELEPGSNSHVPIFLWPQSDEATKECEKWPRARIPCGRQASRSRRLPASRIQFHIAQLFCCCLRQKLLKFAVCKTSANGAKKRRASCCAADSVLMNATSSCSQLAATVKSKKITLGGATLVLWFAGGELMRVYS